MKRSRATSPALYLRYPDGARCGCTSPSASRKRSLEIVVSGKSARSRASTSPMLSKLSAARAGSRRADAEAVTGALPSRPVGARSGDEDQAELADLHLVAVGEGGRLDPLPVHIGAVEAAHVPDG